MICRLLTLAASVLLLTSAVRSVNRDDRISVRDEWCSRVCPKRTISVPATVPGTPPPECPHLTCPTPECATPVCPPPPPPPVCANCPEGSPSAPRTLPWKTLKNYTFTPQGYYKYYSEMYVDWFDAQIFCESEGANLLILNSEEEDNYIRNQMKPGWIHIGIHHLFPDRGFTTVLAIPAFQKRGRYQLHTVRECLVAPAYLSFSAPRGSPLVPRLNALVLRLVQSGTYAKMEGDALLNFYAHFNGTPPTRRAARPPEPLALRHLHQAFQVLGIALLITATIFTGELIWHQICRLKSSPVRFLVPTERRKRLVKIGKFQGVSHSLKDTVCSKYPETKNLYSSSHLPFIH